MELVGGGSVIKGATPSSLYIRVGCDGRCGEASEVLPACNTGNGDPAASASHPSGTRLLHIFHVSSSDPSY